MPLPIQKRVESIAASPCVDACTPQGTPNDMKGIPRPIEASYDMDAHEFFEFFETHPPLVTKNWQVGMSWSH